MSDTGLAIPYNPAFRTADYNRMAARARFALQMMPQLGTNPNVLAQMAQAPIDPGLVAEQARAMRGTLDADREKARLEAMAKPAQRASWELYTAADQQALIGLGYVYPTSETSRPWGADFLGDIAAPLGSVYEAGYNIASTGLGYGLAGLQEAAELPMEMYREIRQQPEIVQYIALAGAALATGGLAAAGAGALGAGAAMGASAIGAGALGSVATYGMTAMGGAYLAAGLASTLRGNPDFWGDTFSLGPEAGERDFQRGAREHATDILGDDGQILSLAMKYGFEGDPVGDLLEEYAGQRGAADDQLMKATSERIVTENLGLVPNTDEYQQAFGALDEITKMPEFREAVSYLQTQKISMGRDFAGLFGLDTDEGLGKIVSGGVDALSWFVLDPILGAGKIARFNRAARWGVRSDLAGEELGARIAKIFSEKQTQTRMGHLADALVEGEDGLAKLRNADPDLTRLWEPLKEWNNRKILNYPQGDHTWHLNRVQQFFSEAEGLTALAAGKGPAYRHGMLEIPHLSRVGELAQDVRLNLRNATARWDIPLGWDEILPEYRMANQVIPTSRDDRLWEGMDFAIDVVAGNPVLRKVVHPIGAFVESMLTKIPALQSGKIGYIPLTHQAQGGERIVEEVGALVDLGRIFKMPKYVRDQWLNTIMGATSEGERRAAVNSFYEMMFKATGMRDVAEGTELTERFITHARQAYGTAGDLGVFLTDHAELLAIPSVKDLRHAARDLTIFNKILNVADTPILDTFVSKIWKPAVLLRIGFVTRAVGDELLSWLAREGPYGWVAQSMARSIAAGEQGDPVVAHARWIESTWNRLRRPIVYDTDFGFKAFAGHGVHASQVSDLDRAHVHILETYSRAMRSLGRSGLGVRGDNVLSSWLTKDGTLRSLVAGGVPDDYLEGIRIMSSRPEVASQMLRETSSSRSVAADAVGGVRGQSMIEGYTLTDQNAGPAMRVAGWESIHPDTPGAAFDAQRRQATTWAGDGPVLSQVVAGVESRYVDERLAASIDGLGMMPLLEDIVAADLPVTERALLWNILLGDSPTAKDRWQSIINGLEDLPGDGGMHPARLGWEGGRKVTPQVRLTNVEKVLRESGRADLADLIERTKAMMSAHPSARMWLGYHIDANAVPVLRRGWTQEELNGEIADAVRTALLDPDRAGEVSRMTYASRGAKSKIPAALPLPEGQIPLFVAYAPRHVLAALPTERESLQAFLRARNVSLSDDGFEMLWEALRHKGPLPPHYDEAGMLPLFGATTVDPRLAKEVGGVLARLGKLEDVSVYGQVPAPANVRAVGAPWTRGTTEAGHVSINPAMGPTPADVSPRAGLHLVDGSWVPGLSKEELVDEYVEVYTQAYLDRFHSRAAGEIVADDDPVTFFDEGSPPDAGDIDAPDPVEHLQGVATYKGTNVRVEPRGPMEDLPESQRHGGYDPDLDDPWDDPWDPYVGYVDHPTGTVDANGDEVLNSVFDDESMGWKHYGTESDGTEAGTTLEVGEPTNWVNPNAAPPVTEKYHGPGTVDAAGDAVNTSTYNEHTGEWEHSFVEGDGNTLVTGEPTNWVDPNKTTPVISPETEKILKANKALFKPVKDKPGAPPLPPGKPWDPVTDNWWKVDTDVDGSQIITLQGGPLEPMVVGDEFLGFDSDVNPFGPVIFQVEEVDGVLMYGLSPKTVNIEDVPEEIKGMFTLADETAGPGKSVEDFVHPDEWSEWDQDAGQWKHYKLEVAPGEPPELGTVVEVPAPEGWVAPPPPAAAGKTPLKKSQAVNLADDSPFWDEVRRAESEAYNTNRQIAQVVRGWQASTASSPEVIADMAEIVANYEPLRQALPERFMLYRGISVDAVTGEPRLTPGRRPREITNRPFDSWTADKRTALNFAEHYGQRKMGTVVIDYGGGYTHTENMERFLDPTAKWGPELQPMREDFLAGRIDMTGFSAAAADAGIEVAFLQPRVLIREVHRDEVLFSFFDQHEAEFVLRRPQHEMSTAARGTVLSPEARKLLYYDEGRHQVDLLPQGHGGALGPRPHAPNEAQLAWEGVVEGGWALPELDMPTVNTGVYRSSGYEKVLDQDEMLDGTVNLEEEIYGLLREDRGGDTVFLMMVDDESHRIILDLALPMDDASAAYAAVKNGEASMAFDLDRMEVVDAQNVASREAAAGPVGGAGEVPGAGAGETAPPPDVTGGTAGTPVGAGVVDTSGYYSPGRVPAFDDYVDDVTYGDYPADDFYNSADDATRGASLYSWFTGRHLDHSDLIEIEQLSKREIVDYYDRFVAAGYAVSPDLAEVMDKAGQWEAAHFRQRISLKVDKLNGVKRYERPDWLSAHLYSDYQAYEDAVTVHHFVNHPRFLGPDQVKRLKRMGPDRVQRVADDLAKMKVTHAKGNPLAQARIRDLVERRTAPTIRYDPEMVAMDFAGPRKALEPYADELSYLGVDPAAAFPDENTYIDFLVGVNTRMIAGEDMATAIGGQARWMDMVPPPVVPEMAAGTRATAGPARRFLWETNGPLAIEDDMRRHGRGLKLTKSRFEPDIRGDLHGVQYDEHVPVASNDLGGLVPNHELPALIQREMMTENEMAALGAWDRFVQYGFGKVIGPMIDSLIRQPLTFHRFAVDYADSKNLAKWWAHPMFDKGDDIDTVVMADGSTKEVRVGDGAFTTVSRNVHDRMPGRHLEDLDEREKGSVGRTLDAIGLTDSSMPFDYRWKMMMRDQEGALAEVDAFLGRPTGGIPADGVAADKASRADARVTRQILENAKNTTDETFSGEMLISWWRNVSKDPTKRDALRMLESSDRNVQRKGARALSQNLRVTLSPAEIRTVKAGAEASAQVEKLIVKTAQERAVADVIPFIDRDNVRAQGQEYVRNLIPFWFAEDQFMRRWVRTASYAPEMVRKAQLLYMGLSNAGVVKEDEYGQAYFVYPGTTVLAKLVSSLPFIDDRLPIAEALTGQVRYSLPGLDRFGVPQVSPLLGIPLDNLTNIFPEMREFSQAVQGDRGGTNRGVLRAIVPASIFRFADAVLSDDSDQKLGSAMMTAAQVLDANGEGLPDNATSDQIEAHMDRLRNHARSILLAQALFGFVAPASPQHQIVGVDGRMLPFYDFASLTGIDSPEIALNDEYIQMVRNLGVEEGTVEFLNTYPDSTPEDLFNRNIAYRVGKTKSVTGAPLPPLGSAMDFYDENKTWMEQNPTAGAWLLPPAETQAEAGDRDILAYMDQQAAGLRVRKAPAEFIRDLKFATGSSRYFNTLDVMDQKIAANPDSTARHVMETKKSIWQSSYLATHPIFAEELQSGEGRARRALVLTKLREAFADPESPDPWHRRGLEVMVRSFDRYRSALIELSTDSSKRGRERRDALRVAFEDWGTRLTASRPELAPLWNSVIRIEARVD